MQSLLIAGVVRMTIEKIDAEIENIKKILTDDERFYQIPDYQRPYSWEKDNLSALIDDLVTAFLNSNEENYFCGSLVLVENKDDGRFDIIDGQQRITTFTILSCVFREIYFDNLDKRAQNYINLSIQDQYEKDKRKLKFLTNEKYQIDFEETVLKKIVFKETRHIEKEFPKNKYLQNAHYLKNFLTEKIEEENIKINNFIIWFYENIVLTVIICPSQDSAIQIFNVLNDRGMPLSPIDILKSTLMQKIGEDNKEDRKAFNTKWEDIASNLRFVNIDIENMLTAYLYYKIAQNPKSRLDKELINVFNKGNNTASEIINEIGNFSESYIKLLQLEDRYIYCLRYLRHRIYWTSILTIALFNDYKDFEKLKKNLLAYYYQNWISGATVARIKQTSFNILKLVKNKEPIDSIEAEIKQNLEKYQTTKTYKEELTGSYVYDMNWSKSLLLLVEYFYQDNSSPKSYIKIDKQLHLEHVLPKEPTTHGWDKIFNKEEIAIWTNSLANLTLLSLRKNVQAFNYDFQTKKEAYKNKDNIRTSFILTQEIANKDNWGISELENRELSLIKRINNKLNIFE